MPSRLTTPLIAAGETFRVSRDCARWWAAREGFARPVWRRHRGPTPSAPWTDPVLARSSADNAGSAGRRWAVTTHRWRGRRNTRRPSRRPTDAFRTRTARGCGCGSCRPDGRADPSDDHVESSEHWGSDDGSRPSTATTPPICKWDYPVRTRDTLWRQN